MASSSSPSSTTSPLIITGYSFLLAADSHFQNGAKTTYLNVEYEYSNSSHTARIPMHKDEFASIRGDLNSSRRLIDLLRSRH
uniref:Uncharacterized protein n=1 Tax=Caenorhabditis tropicalis TaxID=1561998 RepID=A0A1I7UJ71_9PELO